jgi:hypothetical protein
MPNMAETVMQQFKAALEKGFSTFHLQQIKLPN